ncbi:MAG: DUF2007 domain-containing protein [Steroidobacteraceae bacterium]
MKKVFSAESMIEATHVVNLLQAEGIRAELRNSGLSGIVGELPFLEAWPQVWVANLDQARALEVVESFRAGVGADGEPWNCPRCGERIEPQFGECWQCGSEPAEEGVKT